MRAVIFSDVHGNQYAYRAFLRVIQGISYDFLIFCGDIFGYYYGQDEIVDGFKALTNLYAVRGNHDEIAIQVAEGRMKPSKGLLEKYGHSYCMLSKQSVEYAKQLPDKLELAADKKKVLVVHGTAEDRLNGRLYPADKAVRPEQYAPYDYVLCGHTHYKMYRKEGHTVLLNPGSLGQQRDGKGFGYALLDFETGQYAFCNIALELAELEKEIDLYDKGNVKLKQILHRGGY